MALAIVKLQEMLSERCVHVDHTNIYRWVIHYSPKLKSVLNFYRSGIYGSDALRIDETYIKVKGKWKYLYRAITKEGDTVDFYLSHTRNSKVARRFLSKAIHQI